MMIMDRRTGKLLTGVEAQKASIRNIVLTRLGSVPLLRDFGSRALDLIDSSQTSALAYKAEIMDAIDRWEESLEVKRVTFTPGGRQGFVRILVEFTSLEDGSDQIAEVDL